MTGPGPRWTDRPSGIPLAQTISGRRTYVVTTADTLVPDAQRAMAASVGADVVEIALLGPATSHRTAAVRHLTTA